MSNTRVNSSPSTSSSLSSARSSDSASIAIKVRHGAFVLRQKIKRTSKGIDIRLLFDDVPSARLGRAKSLCSIVMPKKPTTASPIKRVVNFFAEHFLPRFLSPKKKRFSGRILSPVRPPPIPRLVFNRNNVPRDTNSVSGTRRGANGSGDEDVFQDVEDDKRSVSPPSTAGTPTPIGGQDVRNLTPLGEPDNDARSLTDEQLFDVGDSVSVRQPVDVDQLTDSESSDGSIIWSLDSSVSEEFTMERVETWRGEVMPGDPVINELDFLLNGVETGGTENRRVARAGLRFRPYATPRVPMSLRLDIKTLTEHANSFDILISSFAQYELAWRRINNDVSGELTFSTVPWPMFITATAPVDVTRQQVYEFILHAKRPPHFRCLKRSPRLLKDAAKHEITSKWDRDVFTRNVLPRVADRIEAVWALYASFTVLRALEDIVEGNMDLP